MKIGFIGLGKMGQALVWHLLEQKVDIVLYNRTREKMDQFLKEFQSESIKHDEYGELILSYDYKTFMSELETPRIIWIMVEHGSAVDEVIDNLIISDIKSDDIIIDGGNSFYKDSIKRYQKLKKMGVGFLDIGTSGGIEGARNGACLMVGGEKEIFERVKPILKMLAVAGGLTYFGETGSGHFVKMVHNGVEYGMLQALGEGFEILFNKANKVDLRAVAANWKNGSVVRGWLIELLERALSTDPQLRNVSGTVGGGSTGEWTIETARELGVDVPVIESSLQARKMSKKKETFSGKVVSALRKEFGGHPT
ncbi:6-phosphogluconate dehydrogenase (decarboxylating) [Candidatus Gottesmanbacteria bacterium RBG_16_37_8]|uniref:6-phosphogluconate dehydrogenase (Decarboxylating) n=1 Tax=Candidatus Gottesmanbacteria bacterium RBG_16_37_8 TaxID=1798371 RepID=A0A1F5YPT5_9BACT|nr:MAG: 6-phosphogluconate dehydrogenase (decarboxylating) [Candidatus Gottesmanbacteria bacterium RBG_16_37_8]